MKKETNPHNIHIGSIIKTKVTERGISDTELAKTIHF
jgi:plasmid maintenance system antidote protein VapI